MQNSVVCENEFCVRKWIAKRAYVPLSATWQAIRAQVCSCSTSYVAIKANAMAHLPFELSGASPNKFCSFRNLSSMSSSSPISPFPSLSVDFPTLNGQNSFKCCLCPGCASILLPSNVKPYSRLTSNYTQPLSTEYEWVRNSNIHRNRSFDAQHTWFRVRHSICVAPSQPSNHIQSPFIGRIPCFPSIFFRFFSYSFQKSHFALRSMMIQFCCSGNFCLPFSLRPAAVFVYFQTE